MRGDALTKLAQVLETTEMWLLRGVGPEVAQEDVGQAEERAELERFYLSLGSIESVGPVERRSIVLTRMDLASGACSFFSDPASRKLSELS